MITYIVKTILCAAFFLLFHKLVLEKEQMFRFNRFYLLFGLALSFIIPLLVIETQIVPIAPLETNFIPQTQEVVEILPDETNNENTPEIRPVMVIYLVVTILLSTRFLLHFVAIFYRIWKYKHKKIEGGKLVLVEGNTAPYSFLHYIFLCKETYQAGKIEEEILIHELAHVRQKHSLDILLVEIAGIFLWFNPVLFFYYRAIQLNHELLADAAVLQRQGNIKAYQTLILEKSKMDKGPLITSKFNYSTIKTRLEMMTKKTSFRNSVLKKLMAVSIILSALVMFGQRIDAQGIASVNAKKGSELNIDELEISVTSNAETEFDMVQYITGPDYEHKNLKALKTPYKFTLKAEEARFIFKSNNPNTNLKVVVKNEKSILTGSWPIVIIERDKDSIKTYGMD